MAEEKEKDPNKELRDLFAKTINRHGHPFQNAVIALAYKMLQQNKSDWQPEVMEFPVAAGQGTRIDIILTDRSGCRLIVECKRVNPAFNAWLFAKATKLYRNNQFHFIAEKVNYEEGILTSNGTIIEQIPNSSFYHIAHQIKKGDSPSNTDAIEEAATQVCRGLNGMVNFFKDHLQVMKTPPENKRLLVPVIMTTDSGTVYDGYSFGRRGYIYG